MCRDRVLVWRVSKRRRTNTRLLQAAVAGTPGKQSSMAYPNSVEADRLCSERHRWAVWCDHHTSGRMEGSWLTSPGLAMAERRHRTPSLWIGGRHDTNLACSWQSDPLLIYEFDESIDTVDSQGVESISELDQLPQSILIAGIAIRSERVSKLTNRITEAECINPGAKLTRHRVGIPRSSSAKCSISGDCMT